MAKIKVLGRCTFEVNGETVGDFFNEEMLALLAWLAEPSGAVDGARLCAMFGSRTAARALADLDATLGRFGGQLSMIDGRPEIAGLSLLSDLGWLESLAIETADGAILSAAMTMLDAGVAVWPDFDRRPAFGRWRRGLTVRAERLRGVIAAALQAHSRCVAAVPQPCASIKIGRWIVETGGRLLRSDSEERALTPKAAAVLGALLAQRGKVVSRTTLMSTIWPDSTVVPEALTNAIGELKKALGEGPQGGALVRTVYREGYCLVDEPSVGAPFLSRGSGCDQETPESVVLTLEAARIGEQRGRAGLDEAEKKLRKAVGLAPGDAFARAALAAAICFRWQHTGTGAGLSSALAIADGAVQAASHLAASHAARGFALAMLNRSDEARASVTRALSGRSIDFDVWHLCARVLFALGETRMASVVAARTAETHATDFQCRLLAARAAAACSDKEGATRMTRAALRRVDMILAENPANALALSARPPLLALDSRADEALNALRLQDAENDYYVVATLAHLGELKSALDALEGLVASGWSDAGWLQTDAMLDSLRADARFLRIIAPIAA